MLYHCDDHPRCNYVSTRRNNIERHRRTMHARNRKYHCCGRRFRTKFAFHEHTKAEHQSAGYACTWEGCSVVCSRLALLVRHLRVHTGEKPHECPAPGCDYRSNNRSNLERHTKTVHRISLSAPSRKRKTAAYDQESTSGDESTDDAESGPEDSDSPGSEGACGRYCEALLDAFDMDRSTAIDYSLNDGSSDADNKCQRYELPTPPLSGELHEEVTPHQRLRVLVCPDCSIRFASQFQLTCHRESRHKFVEFDAARALVHFWERSRGASSQYLFSS